jgi:hypothetical protein
MYDNLNREEYSKWKLGNNARVDLLVINPRMKWKEYHEVHGRNMY